MSAQADNFRVFFEGRAALIGGTSAASPTFAGIVSLLNDARLSKGLPPLGFLNPLLYTIGQAGLNDITEGNNPGCGTNGFNVSVSLRCYRFSYEFYFIISGYKRMGSW